jgi:hypothetical protein
MLTINKLDIIHSNMSNNKYLNQKNNQIKK